MPHKGQEKAKAMNVSQARETMQCKAQARDALEQGYGAGMGSADQQDLEQRSETSMKTERWIALHRLLADYEAVARRIRLCCNRYSIISKIPF
jgi:ribulose bisphosphate carboxylase small subunit